MTTLWVGSLWHRDCDAFMTVIGREAATVDEALEIEARREYQSIMDDIPEDEPEPDVDICSSGPHSFSLREVIDEFDTIPGDLLDLLTAKVEVIYV